MPLISRAVLLFLLLFVGRTAAATQEYSAQLGLVPWKAAGRIDNLAQRELFERLLADKPDMQIVEFERLWLPGRYWAAAEVLSVAGNAGPDVMQVRFSELGGYVRSGLVVSMDRYVDKWKEKGRFPESLTRSLMIEGNHWGAVSDVNFALLAGNRAIFSSLGLGPEAMPATWEDLVHLASLLRLPGKRYGLLLPSGKPLAYLWMALARQAGGEGVAAIGPKGVEVDLLMDPAQRAAAFLARAGESLRKAGRDTFCLIEDPNVLRQMFAEGQAAMALVSYADMDFELFDPGTRGKGEFALQPLRPHLAPVPGAFGPEPLAYAIDGRCAVLPGYIGDEYRQRNVWEFHTRATSVTADFDREWLKMAPGKQAEVATIFKMRYPDHPAVAHLPANWAKALADAYNSVKAMPPDAQFEELATMLGDKLTGLLKEGGNPAAILIGVQRDFDFKVHNKFRMTSKVWRALGWLSLIALLSLLVFGIVRLAAALREELRDFRGAPAEAAPPARLLVGILLFLPATLLAVIFGIVPLLNGLRMSFFSHVLREGGAFVGVHNYLDVVTNANTHLALTNTAAYLGLSFLMAFIAPFVLALVLASFPRGQFLIRSAFFLPAIASAVVLAILWQQMYDISGPFNDLATLLGFGPREWLKEPGLAMFSVVLAQSWCFLGISGLTYIAGLSVIPEEQYEDAEIMGAGLLDRFVNVTYPNIRPLLGINLVGWLINTARTAEHVFLMTGGGPDKATHVIGLEIFDQAYLKIRFGYAMAEVWLLVAVILIFSIYQMRAIRAGQIQARED